MVPMTSVTVMMTVVTVLHVMVANETCADHRSHDRALQPSLSLCAQPDPSFFFTTFRISGQVYGALGAPVNLCPKLRVYLISLSTTHL